MNRLSLSSRTVTQGVWRLFFVTTFIFLVALGALYWNLSRVTEEARDIERTEAIERELRRLGEDVLDAETGQRGYLLTQNEDYLEPYLAGAAAVGQRITRLRELMRQPQAKENLARLEPLITAKMEILARTIAMTQQGQQQEALALVRTGQGKYLMDEFRRVRTATIDLELRLLAERRARFMSELHNIFLTCTIGGGIAMLLLFVSASNTARRLKQPILALLNGIRVMSEGGANYKVQVKSQDEIGRVADAFNVMAEHIVVAQQARDTALSELERSNAELDNFAYVASHDLKAPLRGIRNLAEWITEDVEKTSSEDTRENLRLLSGRVNRLDGLLESLLAYSRVGRKTAATETVDCAHLIDEIRDYLAPDPGFQVTRQGSMPVLLTPKVPLEQVLRNLINNAIKHHDRKSGQITISTQDREGHIEFRVTDDGPGIEPEFHTRIFQMFQTLKPRDQIEGSGMGLAIVKKTVESFGGVIHVESSPPARGTTFVFTWPKMAAPDSATG